MKKKLNGEKMNEGIRDELKETLWIDGLQRQVKLRKNALKEVYEWLSTIDIENNPQVQGQAEVIQLFSDILYVMREDNGGGSRLTYNSHFISMLSVTLFMMIVK